MEQGTAPQHLLLVVFFRCRSSWLEGSGSDSLGTRCMTAVFPHGNPRADKVTFPCRNLPWYINLKISAFDTASSSHSSGQLSNTYWAISPALPLGLNRYSLVLPDTRIRRRFILSAGMCLDPSGILLDKFSYSWYLISSWDENYMPSMPIKRYAGGPRWPRWQ